MTDFNASDRDVSRAIRSWLHEDRHEDASRIAGAVLDRVDTTPRRRITWWPARRMPIVNRFVTIGLGTAAAVAFAPHRLCPAPTIWPTAGRRAVDICHTIDGRGINGRTLGRARRRPGAARWLAAPLDGRPSGVSITVEIPGDGWWGDAGTGLVDG